MSEAWNESSDGSIIEACLDGNEKAWIALVNRYRRLVYSIPLKWGLAPEDAVDIFQAVWLDCFRQLSSLRNTDRLQPWLIRITIRKCHRFSSHKRDRAEDLTSNEPLDGDYRRADSPAFLPELDREQLIRAAIDRLTPRCRELIELLFFKDPRPSYQDVATRLGLSENSIGFTRERCLDSLRKILTELGYTQ
jgi:RNA polymerase sigma factor (sigma-70 family)